MEIDLEVVISYTISLDVTSQAGLRQADGAASLSICLDRSTALAAFVARCHRARNWWSSAPWGLLLKQICKLP